MGDLMVVKYSFSETYVTFYDSLTRCSAQLKYVAILNVFVYTAGLMTEGL